MQEHLMGISENLYKAQSLLASHKGGTFYKWFESLGLKKDFVYMCIRRYELYLKYRKEEVMKLPDRVVKEVAKLSKDLEDERVYEIIEAPRPQAKIKELRELLLERIIQNHQGEILDKRVLEKQKAYERELFRVQGEIIALQKRLKELKKQEKILFEEIENLKK
jgi:hypothetical protein